VTIKNGQSRDTDNIGHTKTKQNINLQPIHYMAATFRGIVKNLNNKIVLQHTGARCVRKKPNKLYNTTRGRTHLLPFF
jgi:hypothetical protein